MGGVPHAFLHATGGARIRGAIGTGRGSIVGNDQADPPLAGLFGRADLDGELIASKFHLQPPGKTGTESQVDIVPKDRRVPAERGEGADPAMAMRVPLHDFDPGLDRRIVEGSGKLAKSPADG